MSGLGGLALTTAPIAGGALLGLSVGKVKPQAPNVRAIIFDELELLRQIPEADAARRDALRRTIEDQVDRLIVLNEKSRTLRRKFGYFTEKANWRDLVLFVSAVLFAVIVWNFEHRTWHWLPMLIATILLSVVTAATALHGFIKSLRTSTPSGETPAGQPPSPASGTTGQA